MRAFIIDIFHIYVIAMMGSFFLLCMLAGSGIFDIWGNRYLSRKRKSPYNDNQTA
jgi:hypothetical protein